MEKVKKMLMVAACLSLLFALAYAPGLKAHADDATTWYVTFDKNSSKWCESKDKTTWVDLTLSGINDGDKIVINADGETLPLLELKTKKNISEVAFIGGVTAALTAPRVDYTYAVKGSIGVINGNVGKVDAFGGAVMQVNGNVDCLTAFYEDGTPTFAVTGTVGKANVRFSGNLLKTDIPMYNVAAGKFKSEADGTVRIDEKYYSLEEVAVEKEEVAPVTEAPKPGVLDDVPKTGSFEFSLALIFLCISVGTAVCAVIYRKKGN